MEYGWSMPRYHAMDRSSDNYEQDEYLGIINQIIECIDLYVSVVLLKLFSVWFFSLLHESHQLFMVFSNVRLFQHFFLFKHHLGIFGNKENKMPDNQLRDFLFQKSLLNRTSKICLPSFVTNEKNHTVESTV